MYIKELEGPVTDSRTTEEVADREELLSKLRRLLSLRGFKADSSTAEY